MNENDIDVLYRFSNKRISEVSLARKRYLYDQIDWSDRLIGLKGSRGVGKTTLLLQKIRESGDERKHTLYVSLDNIWLEPREICTLAEYHVAHGGTRLVLDEIHYVEKWQNLVKTLNDSFPELRVAYTGSSMLKIKSHDGDLSRRLSDYELKGLSFREYLGFEGLYDGAPVSLENILENHEFLAGDLTSRFKVLPAFERYQRIGYYPFYRENEARYVRRLLQVINQVLESDWPSVEDVSVTTIRRARQMLRILSARPPQTPNMSALYAQLETDRKLGMKILAALQDAGLIQFLTASVDNFKSMVRPEKIFCDNANIMFALCASANIGSVREAFFLNQVGFTHKVVYPKCGDFKVDDKWLFEVGGRGKGFDQIKDLPNSYVINDDVEVGHGNKIPLWLFGFLY